MLPFLGTTLLDAGTAVLLFFCISGFLITYALEKKYTDGHWILSFILNRALRIYPAYLLVLAVTVLCGIFGLVDLRIGFGDFGSPLTNAVHAFPDASIGTKIIIIASNLTTIGLDTLRTVSFDPHSGRFVLAPGPGRIAGLSFTLMGQAWTLGSEMIFYFVAPYIVRRLDRIAGAVIIVTLLTRYNFPYSQIANFWLHAFTFLVFFLAGAALCRLYIETMERRARNRWRPLAVAALGLAAAGFITVDTNARFVVLTGACALPILFHLTRRSTIDAWLGELSYPVYLTHFLLMQASREYLGASTIDLFYYVGVLLSAVLLVIAVEEPMKRWRGLIAAKLRATPLERGPVVATTVPELAR